MTELDATLFSAEAIKAPAAQAQGAVNVPAPHQPAHPNNASLSTQPVQLITQYSLTELNKPSLAVQWRILQITFCAGSGCAAAHPAAAGWASRAAAASLAGESPHGRADGPLRLPLARAQG